VISQTPLALLAAYCQIPPGFDGGNRSAVISQTPLALLAAYCQIPPGFDGGNRSAVISQTPLVSLAAYCQILRSLFPRDRGKTFFDIQTPLSLETTASFLAPSAWKRAFARRLMSLQIFT
jgi:hypothetical protein